MKRWIALLLVAVLLAGCEVRQPEEELPTFVSTNRIGSDHEGVELRIAGISRDEHGNRLEIEWISNSRETIIFGASYEIQRLEGETWVNCATAGDIAFVALAYELGSFQVRKEVYHPDGMFDLSKPGTYRFRSECSVEGMDHCQVWAEFSVDGAQALKRTEEAVGPIPYTARRILFHTDQEQDEYPRVLVIRSVEELEAAEQFSIQRIGEDSRDPTDPGQMYNETFFESKYLVIVELREDSGSIRRDLKAVKRVVGGQLAVEIDVTVPEACTSDLVQWNILLELDREYMVASERDVLVELSGGK